MWEVSSTAASLSGLPWNGALPLPASNFDLSGLPRLIGALLLLFVLPGIALNRLVLRRYSFSAASTIAITLTLSLMAAIVAGFILDLMPGGLRPLSWTAILGAVTLGSLLVGFALTAFDRLREARSWKRQRFGFTGLRLLLGRKFGALGAESGEMSPERLPYPFRGQPVDSANRARKTPRALSGMMRGCVPGGTERLAGNVARHRLGFAGLWIEAPERRFLRAARPAHPAGAPGRRNGLPGGAGAGRSAGPGTWPAELPPQWRVLAAAPRRAGRGPIVHRFGFAGAQVLLLAREPAPPARALLQLEAAASSLARWYGDRLVRPPSTRGVDRTRGASLTTPLEHRFGFSGVRVLPVPPPVIEPAPGRAGPGRSGVEGQPALVVPHLSRRLRFSPVQLLLLAVALSLTSYAFLSAVSTVQSRRGSGFTQLWITTEKRASVETLSLGVTSQELGVTTFRLLLVSGDRTVAEWPSLQLASGQSFFARVDVDPASLVVPSVSVVLYRLDAPTTPYRLVQASVGP